MKKIFSLSAALMLTSGAVAQVEVATLENDQLDYLALDADSHIPQFTEDFDEEIGFQAGDFWFDMYTWSDYQTWWGFGVANHTATTFTSFSDQFNACTGGGHNGSANYGVGYVLEMFGPVYVTLTTAEMSVVPGMYVTNSAYAYSEMRSKPFGAGDWFKLTITGFDDEEDVVGTKEFMLCDLTSEDPDKWYIVDDWQYVDLSTLGAVRTLFFSLSSTDNHPSYGMNTPAYFCFDDLGAQGVETTPTGNWNKTPTALDTVRPAGSLSGKFLQDGRLFFVKDGLRFDAQGRRF